MGKRGRRVRAPSETEKAENARLVHEWIITQCYLDPDFHKIYEDYIGPVPTVRMDAPGMRCVTPKFPT